MLTNDSEMNIDILKFTVKELNNKMGTDLELEYDSDGGKDRFFYLSVGDTQITDTFWDAQEMYAYLEGVKKGIQMERNGKRYDG